MIIDGESVPVDQEGIWEYAIKQQEVTLIPVFTYDKDVETEAEENEDHLILNINEEGNDGIAMIVESENKLEDGVSEEANVIALYQMNSNGHYELKRKDGCFYYLIKDGEILCSFSQEKADETDQ